jgi:hypothetical protein
VADGVGELFKRNGGVATRAELIALGFSATKIRRFLRDGLLVSVRQGVYAAGSRDVVRPGQDEEARRQARRLAAVLARANAGWAGSHETAATIHGLETLRHSPGSRQESPIVLTRPPGGTGSRSRRDGVRVHVAQLPARDVIKRHGVPVTSATRTVIDLSRTGTFAEGVVVTDSALRSGQVTRAGLEAALAAMHRWPRIRQARSVVTFSDERAESPLESLARVIFHQEGLPKPELQVWVHDQYAARIGRVDFLWPRYRTVGEADGKVKYERYGVTAQQQLDRDKKLRQAGYEPVHFSWQGVMYETDQVIGELVAAFERAAI